MLEPRFKPKSSSRAHNLNHSAIMLLIILFFPSNLLRYDLHRECINLKYKSSINFGKCTCLSNHHPNQYMHMCPCVSMPTCEFLDLASINYFLVNLLRLANKLQKRGRCHQEVMITTNIY